jgi:UDP-N-acetylglucosamine diphosphorylase / glucose-1-phosphate thymidylyltransferase / UDP-N-acetylgalactosamine diphosphorylase / glucosamine-1-phosphate N-acetyltransferase / galactosamine-1-phosphate N-acetyltransferase
MTEAIFFDDGLGLLSPLTDLRASFDVRTGAFTTLERHCRVLGLVPVSLMVPSHLADVTRERHAAVHPGAEKPVSVNALPRSSEPRLFINGRCPLPYDFIAALEPGQAVVESGSRHLIAAVVEPAEFREFLQNGALPVPASGEREAPALISRPWHVITFRDRCLDTDLETLTGVSERELPPGVLGIGEHPQIIAPTAVVYPGVTLDMEKGPVVVADHAVVRPGATIIGPAFIGEHATVLDKALIKPHTVLGPWCKAAGEVGGVLFQAYSNKGHEGHLGDAYVGEWVNLGAGTTNSNLLNTYSEVIAKAPGGGNERTGLQFLGAIIGDHVKTAISTRIMTGSILQTGGMFAQSAPVVGTSARFAWATDAGVKTFRFDKFVDTARAMMARRKTEPSEAALSLLASLAEAEVRV